MIPAGLVLVLLVGFALEAIFVCVDQGRRVRAEQAYWARQAPCELYDWATETDPPV